MFLSLRAPSRWMGCPLRPRAPPIPSPPHRPVLPLTLPPSPPGLVPCTAAAGEGAPFNPAVAHKLLQLLAEAGDPEAQTDLGIHYALGVEPLAPNARNQLLRLVPPDVPLALTHYQFGAQVGARWGCMSACAWVGGRCGDWAAACAL